VTDDDKRLIKGRKGIRHQNTKYMNRLGIPAEVANSYSVPHKQTSLCRILLEKTTFAHPLKEVPVFEGS